MNMSIPKRYLLVALLSSCASASSSGADSRRGASAAAPHADQQSSRDLERPASRVSGAGSLHAGTNTGISTETIDRLSLAWVLPTDAPVSHAPLLDGDTMYFADWGGWVYKVDAPSGEIQWKKQFEQPKTSWPWHGFAATGALAGGTLYEASVEGNLFAINTSTGDLKWQTRVADDPHAGVLGKILHHDGRLYLGLQSVEEPLTALQENFEPNFRGKVLAIDGSDGSVIWQTRLVDPPQNGVAVWTDPAIDPELGLLYVATGNNYTGQPSALSDSLVALDAATGEIRWHNQAFENDVWTRADQLGPDYDFSGGPQLFDVDRNGKRQKLVGVANKSGIFFVYDRNTGEPVWSTSIGYGGIDGGMHGEASIADGRILAWSNNNYVHTQPPEDHPLSVKALDAATGRPLWVQNKAAPAAIASGYLADDIYFVPSLDGVIRGFRVTDGQQVWKSQQHGPLTAPLVAAQGRLYGAMGNPGIFKDWPEGGSGVFAYTTGATPGGAPSSVR